MTFRVLVCGGRDYRDYSTVARELGAIHAARPITEVINGGAPGADRLSVHWAAMNGLVIATFSADWETHGRAAGPMRNQRMIENKPDLVVAFPGGRGTADMVRRARIAGVPVRTITASARGGSAQGEA